MTKIAVFLKCHGQNPQIFNYGNLHIHRCLKLSESRIFFAKKMWFC